MEIFFNFGFCLIEWGFSTFSNIEKKFIIYELWKNGLEMDFATIERGLMRFRRALALRVF